MYVKAKLNHPQFFSGVQAKKKKLLIQGWIKNLNLTLKWAKLNSLISTPNNFIGETTGRKISFMRAYKKYPNDKANKKSGVSSITFSDQHFQNISKCEKSFLTWNRTQSFAHLSNQLSFFTEMKTTRKKKTSLFVLINSPYYYVPKLRIPNLIEYWYMKLSKEKKKSSRHLLLTKSTSNQAKKKKTSLCCL